MGRKDKAYELLAVLATAAIVVAAAGCSSSAPAAHRSTSPHSGVPQIPSHFPSRTTSSTSGPVIPTFGSSVSAAAPDLQSASFTLKLPDGTNITAELRLSGLLHAGSAADQAWQGVAADSSSLPCTPDTSRDAVIVGDIAFTNATPSFTPSLDLQFKEAAGALTYSVGASYSAGPQCGDLSTYPDHADIAPDFTGATWGPVPIEIVVHNYYSPAAPSGDPSSLDPQGFYFVGLTTNDGPYSFYSVTTTSDIINPLNINGVTYVVLRQVH